MSAYVELGTRRESDEDYCEVVVNITDRTRIIECRAGIQWIIQKRVSAHEASTARWNGLSYHRSRAGLLAALAGLRIDLTAGQRLILDRLPQWIGGGP